MVDPRDKILDTILLFLLGACLFCMLQAATAHCSTHGVHKAILWLLQDAPGRELARNQDRQSELARALISAGSETGIDPYLLTSIAFHESSFVRGARGQLGERGIMQVHGLALRGCEMTSYEGQARCGAHWLRVCIDKCDGDVAAGLGLYGTGRRCDGDQLWVKRRIRMAGILRKHGELQ